MNRLTILMLATAFALPANASFAQNYSNYGGMDNHNGYNGQAYDSRQNQQMQGGNGGNKAAYERMMNSLSSNKGNQQQRGNDDGHQHYEASPYHEQQPQQDYYGGRPTTSGNAAAYQRMMGHDPETPDMHEGHAHGERETYSGMDAEMGHDRRVQRRQGYIESGERSSLNTPRDVFVSRERAEQQRQQAADQERGYNGNSYQPVNR